MTQPDFRQMVENSNSIIVQLDPSGTINYINAHGLEFFGYSENELVGKQTVGLLSPETTPAVHDVAAYLHDILEHPEHYVVNPDENRTSDGEPVWILWNNTPVRDSEGKMIALNAIGIDITELVTQLGDGDPEKGFAMLKPKSRVARQF